MAFSGLVPAIPEAASKMPGSHWDGAFYLMCGGSGLMLISAVTRWHTLMNRFEKQIEKREILHETIDDELETTPVSLNVAVNRRVHR